MILGKETAVNRKNDLGQSTFLSRMKRDQRGNVLAIVAASIIPLVGAIGGGVDLTRAYMAQARLAQACDAAALAGRKVLLDADLNDSGAVNAGTTTDREIQKFISYNFAEGQFDTGTMTRTAVVNDEGELTITLATTMPTQLLPIVGISSLNVATDCSARRSGVNVDVVLVLDVTGSMSSSLDGTTRIAALKTASNNFLEILDDLRGQLTSSGLRVRVGVVPYSIAVNVGRELYADDPSYIKTTGVKVYSEMRGMFQCTSSNSYCGTGKSSNKNKWDHYTSDGSWSVNKYTQEVGPVTLDLTDFVDRGIDDTGFTNSYAWSGCVEMRPTVQSITSTSDFSTIPGGAWDILDVAPGVDGAPAWAPFIYLPEYATTYGPASDAQSTSTNWDFSFPQSTTKVPFRSNELVTTPSARDSAASNSSYVSNPSTAMGPNLGCPTPVRLLNESTAGDMAGYINSLNPTGNTFHDIGMYWGLSLISPQAPFANPDTYLKPGFSGEARAVKRYIVFMTDGDLNANGSNYTAYGLEVRPSGSGNNVTTNRASQPDDQHRARFRMICEAAKRQGIEVSTVAFATDIGTPDKTALESCATSSDNYYEASSASDLNDAFRKIAQNIGFLRVSR